MRISVTGSEDFIVTIGQQLAWLGAACRTSVDQFSRCYTAFAEAKPDSELPQPTFEIRYEVIPLRPDEPTSCWKDLVGDSVIATGFPISERHCEAIGLEIPLQIMATLGGISLVTCYRGGYVLKGRSILLVPGNSGNDFIQWHLAKSDGRVHYHDIDNWFPARLSIDLLDETALQNKRSFLGWCSESSNHLGLYPRNACP